MGAAFASLGYLAALAGCSDPGNEVARVGGEPISGVEYARQLRILKSIRPGSSLDEATRRQVLEQMAKQLLLSQEAKRAGLDADPAVQAAIRKQKEAVRLELEEAIANARAQLAQLDRAAEQKVLIERLLDQRRAS